MNKTMVVTLRPGDIIKDDPAEDAPQFKVLDWDGSNLTVVPAGAIGAEANTLHLVDPMDTVYRVS